MNKEISIKKASVLYGTAKYLVIIIQLIITAVLSRILTPADYGVVAIVTIFTTFFSTLSNLGLGTAIMQFQDLNEEQIQDIFTFSEYFSILLSVLFMLLAYPISIFYDNTIYIPVIFSLSISVFFNAIDMVPNAILLRRHRFMSVGIRMIISTLLSGCVAVSLVVIGFKYYALVGQSIFYAIMQFAWNFKNSGLNFKFKYNIATIGKIRNYSSNQFAYNICNYFAQNLDNLLTGKVMGDEMLAYYNRAYTLMRYPVTNIAHVITPVLHPILAEYQNDYEFIYDEFIKIIKIMSLLGVFITVFCFWADEEIILCYFGTQWMNAVSPFRWLSVCITFQLMNAVFGAIYQSLGKTKEMFHSGIIHISISLIAITAGAYSKNIIILAIFVSISMIVKFFIEVYFLIRRCFSYSILEFLKIFIPELIVGGIMFAVVFIVGDFANGNYWIKLFAKLCICIILYLGLLIITGQYKYLMLLKFKKQNTK